MSRRAGEPHRPLSRTGAGPAPGRPLTLEQFRLVWGDWGLGKWGEGPAGGTRA